MFIYHRKGAIKISTNKRLSSCPVTSSVGFRIVACRNVISNFGKEFFRPNSKNYPTTQDLRSILKCKKVVFLSIGTEVDCIRYQLITTILRISCFTTEP